MTQKYRQHAVQGHWSDSPLAPIELFQFEGVGILFKCGFGLPFTNQAGGLGCLQPEAVGIFVPLPSWDAAVLSGQLAKVFAGSIGPVSVAQADWLDGVLRQHGYGDVTVDRALLPHSFEAWLHVQIGDVQAG